MDKINISNVEVLENSAKFSSKFKFEVKFECLESLEDDLEWKLIYVSSASNTDLDQVIDSVIVGPIPVSRHAFVLDINAPDPAKFLVDDSFGVTVVLLETFHKDQQLVRIDYFVSKEYEKEEMNFVHSIQTFTFNETGNNMKFSHIFILLAPSLTELNVNQF